MHMKPLYKEEADGNMKRICAFPSFCFIPTTNLNKFLSDFIVVGQLEVGKMIVTCRINGMWCGFMMFKDQD